jgi:predicted HTH transcriptional regulator
MDTDLTKIQDLIERPRESLAVELKRWIDPDQPEGKAKIVKATLALRNFNGGYLVIGFDNDTLEPDREHVPSNVMDMFHVDKIQGLISKFSSEPLEISIKFPEREGQQYPVIEVPPGIRTPVAVKSDLCQSDIYLIRAGVSMPEQKCTK